MDQTHLGERWTLRDGSAVLVRPLEPDDSPWFGRSSTDGGGSALSPQEPAGPDTAEASVVVVDAWQGRGLGGILLERPVPRAAEEGVRRFTSAFLTRPREALRAAAEWQGRRPASPT
jgi:GNAT superfamily N-acetyltransferase